MTSWLDRHFVLGCILASVAQFAVAGMHLFRVSQNYPSALQDAALWAILGLVWICIAVAFRSKSSSRANR